MKKNLKSALWIVIAGGLLVVPQQAYAAHWKLTYNVDGQNRNAPYGGPVVEQDWSSAYPGDPVTGDITPNQGGSYDILFYDYPSTVSPSGYSGSFRNYPALTSKIDGEVTVILTWTKDANETVLPPAPSWVGINVNGYSNAQYRGQDSGANVAAEMGNNGSEVGITVAEDHQHVTGQGYYVPEQWVHSKQVSGSYRRVKAVPPGETRVEFKIPLKAQVESHAGSTINSLIGEHELHAALKAQNEPRDVVISSLIEESWKKWPGSAASLPDEYKARDSNGNLTNQPLIGSAIQVGGQETPNDTSDDVWKIKCLRNADGSMEVHSEARFTRGSVPSASSPTISWEWFARPTGTLPNSPTEALQFHASQQGFIDPSYTWAFSGGSLVNTSPVPVNDDYLIRYSDAYDPAGLSGVRIGAMPNISLPSTTTTVSVVDLDPGSPSDSISNEYNVNWHLPVENDVLTLSTPTWTDVPAMTTGRFGNQPDTQQENGSLEVWLDPQPWKSIVALNGTDWLVFGTFSSLLTGGATLAVELGAEGLGAVAGLSKAIPATAVALSAGGASYAFTSTPTASEKQTIVNDSAQWGQAVDETMEALLPPSQRPANSTAQIRIDPPSALDGISAAQLKDTNWTTNPLWSSFKMVPHIRQDYSEKFYDGDGFDEHGYCGVAKTHLTLPNGSPRLYGQYELNVTGTSQY